MYESFYGLRSKPFSLLPDPNMMYASRLHRRALALLEYGIESQAGFAVITGEIGSGKTTLIKYFLRTLDEKVVVGLITNTHSSLGDPLDWVAQAFDIQIANRDPASLYNAFVEFVIEQYAAGKRTVLIIDEAQNFCAQTLEKLRMLSNINSGGDLLLQMILIGQPELLATLNRPELHQFAQRISVSYHLGPLGPSETGGYVAHRMAAAGGSPEVFTKLAGAGIYYFTRGVPRLINSLCDMALVYGFAEEQPIIDLDTVISVVRDRQASGLSPFRRISDDAKLDELATEISSVLNVT